MADSPVQKLYAARAEFYERLFVDALGWSREVAAFFRNLRYLRTGARILDAGCGTGVITKALYGLASEQALTGVQYHAFDVSRGMLARFQQWIEMQHAIGIELQQADVLRMEALPSHWGQYDLIVCSTMLEYLPTDLVQSVLAALKQMLQPQGVLLALITRRTWLTDWLATRWWKTHLYNESEIQTFFQNAGFHQVAFRKLPGAWSRFIMAAEAIP